MPELLKGDAHLPASPWRPELTSFGARLAATRQAMGWTNIAQAATACGLPVETWRTWERGGTPRDLVAVAQQIAARTGVDALWLMGAEEPKGATA